MPRIFAIALLLSAPPSLSPHERELLLAQIENLHRSLAARNGPEELGLAGVRVEIRPEEVQSRRLAGCDLVRTPVRLRGQAGAVLGWLSEARRRGLACKSPLSAGAGEGPGRPVDLRVILWHLAPGPFDARAGDRELKKLRDDLLWLQRQLGDVSGLLALLDVLLDTEGVRLQQARWKGGRLEITAQAVDEAARKAFGEAVDARLDRLSRRPVKTGQVRVMGVQDRKLAPSGLHMSGLAAADALLVAASLARAEILLIDRNLPRLDGHEDPPDADALLERLAARLPLQKGRFGAVLVRAEALAPGPPDADPIAEAPVDLVLRRAPPSAAWRLVASATRTGLLAPRAPKVELTAVLRRRSARQVASMLAWAQGLAIHGDRKLALLLPTGTDPPEPDPGAKGDPISLYAQSAPLAELIAGMTGLPRILDCAPIPATVDLRVRGVSAQRLLSGLLLANGRKLVKREVIGFLLPESEEISLDDAISACPKDEIIERDRPGDDRLAAVIEDQQSLMALVADGGRWRWVSPGDELGDGRRVLRIRPDRLELQGPGGRTDQLGFGPAPDQSAAPSSRPGPTRQGLSDMRLAATALMSGSRPKAVLEDRQGHAHLVGSGDGVGRRCGRIEAVLPGRLLIRLGCPRDHEPERVTMGLHPSF